MNLLFLDTETTGFKHNRLVQLAWEHHPSGKRCNELFMPPEPIEEGATEVHGITHEKVQDRPFFQSSDHFVELNKLIEESIVVCHNAEYDLRVLAKDSVNPKKHICTMKLARAMLPSEHDHKLQGLFSRIKFTVPDEETKAHDAKGDVLVMIGLFAYLFTIEKTRGLTDEGVIEKFLAISSGIPETMPFGKYKGFKFADLPEDYVSWMVTKNDWSSDILKALYRAFPQYATVQA